MRILLVDCAPSFVGMFFSSRGYYGVGAAEVLFTVVAVVVVGVKEMRYGM